MMKKSITFLTSIAMVGLAFVTPLTAHAATATSAETEIKIIVEDSTPITPQPEDPDNPGEPTDPDAPHIENNDNDDSIHNDSIQDTDKLAIWRYPTAMNFKGTYNEYLDYVLNLDVSGSNTSTRRVLSVVDIRSGDNKWEMTAKIDNLQKVDASNAPVGSPITTGYQFLATGVTGQHKRSGLNIDANDFEAYDAAKDAKVNGADSNGKGKIKITEASSVVASAETGKGKGYTGIVMNDLKLKFTPGAADQGSYKGNIEWTLSDTPAAPIP